MSGKCRSASPQICQSETGAEVITLEGSEHFYKLFIELALQFLVLTVQCTAKCQEPSLKETDTAPIVR
jgi:hypothetical protein